MKKPSFAKYAVAALLVAGLVAFTAPSAKAQNNATGAVSVVVTAAIVVAVDGTADNSGLMDWGLLAAPTTGFTTYEMSDLGVVSVGGGDPSGQVLDNVGSVATFKITGGVDEVVTLTLSKVNPSATATLSAPSSPSGTTATLSSGQAIVIVKADLTLSPAAVGQTHSGTMTLEANY